jgi:hypothetical protein
MTVDLENVFQESFTQFLERERENIANNAAERNLCARWAIYLQAVADRHGLKGYLADAEYDRNLGEVKTILDDRAQVVVIVCDLLLHSRGGFREKDNLIAIEMKKTRRPKAEKERDRIRLRALTKDSYDDIWSNDGKTLPEHVCGYDLGYLVELDPRSRSYSIEQYRKGKHVGEWSGKF